MNTHKTTDKKPFTKTAIFAGTLSIAILLFSLVSAAPAAAETGSSEFARISDLNGTLRVKGGYDDDWIGMEVNVPVGAGDSLWLDPGGLAEVEFPGGSRIRMQGESKLDLYEFTVLPASFFTSLEAVEGRLYVRTPRPAGNGQNDPIEIRVPSARISIRPESLVRLDIESGRTRVRVQEGSVQIDPFGPGGPTPIFLGRMEQIRLEMNAEPGFPGYFRTISEDGLERYNRFREDRFYNEGSDGRLEQTLVGQDELDRNGKWVLIGGINYWRPYVSVSWRPYSVGHWAWYNGAGWMWISGEPFGYVTFHYGRWHHDSYYGWVWSPGYVFAPAYVHWISSGPYYAWAPLGPYGYPVSTGHISFTFYTGFGIDLRVWSYAHADYFIGIRHHHHHPGHAIHFRNPERRHFTGHKGKIVKAMAIGERPGSSDKERRFSGSKEKEWKPYPNLPKREENETRRALASGSRKENGKGKTFFAEDRPAQTVRRAQDQKFRRNQAVPEKFSRQGKTDRSIEYFNRAPNGKQDRVVSRGPESTRKPTAGPPPELRKAPSMKRGTPMRPREIVKEKSEAGQYRQALKNKPPSYQKGKSVEAPQKSFGKKGMESRGFFNSGKSGKNK